jgi:hypothetical protein
MQKSSNIWTIISAVAAVAALVIPIALYLLEHPSKVLTVKTISTASVADLRDPALSALKLTYNDQSVNHVTTATIEVTNAGTRPIEIRDFERPLVIRFDEPNSTLAVTVSEREPRNLTPEVTLGTSAITLSPLLLNSGDRFRLNVVLRGNFKEPVVDARIVGIRTVSRTLLRERPTTLVGILLLVLAGLATAAYSYLLLFAIWMQRRPVILLPRRDTTAVVVILGIAAATLVVSGATLLSLSRRPFYWLMVAETLIMICVMIVGIVRKHRIGKTYEVILNPVGGKEKKLKKVET